MRRAAFGALVLVLLTAFAPAPLPRRDRRGDEGVTTEAFQGYWRIVKFETVLSDGRRAQSGFSCKGVRVEGNVWTYVNEDGSNNAVYPFTITHDHRPAHIDWFDRRSGKRPSMIGLIRRRGEGIEITGLGGAAPEQRPGSFETAPAGWWVMTFERGE